MGLLTVIFISFIVSAIIISCSDNLKHRLAPWVFIWPFSLFIFFTTYIPGILDGNTIISEYKWVKSVGVHLDMRLDMLALTFCLMITGVGTLVYWFSGRYLRGRHYIGRFFSYLTFFMASMLGLVLSDNLLTLFLFWELTSISSFFLIGFQHDDAQARRNALIALAVTGGGGFFLMVGLIILGSYMDTYTISEMLARPDVFRNSKVYTPVLLLIFAGAFTKSAQFPFHFWLPGAMKAPTPVSAYLHSATMVKAGVYLLLRLFPVLSGTALWSEILIAVGCTTMVYGAVQSVFRKDMKTILAYSTVSALGTLMLLLGIGTEAALKALFVYLIVHVLYKAALFLIAGVVDYKTKSRDVTLLRGLRLMMPLVATAAAISAMSFAALPLSFGFVGKEMIFESAWNLTGLQKWIVLGSLFVTAVLSMYAAFCTGVLPFWGTLPNKFCEFKRPNKALRYPPLILAILSIIPGLMPWILEGWLDRLMAGTHRLYSPSHLAIWHGWSPILLLSVIAWVVGLILIMVYKVSTEAELKITQLEVVSPKRIIEQISNAVAQFAKWFTKVMHNGYLRIYLMVIVLFFTVLVGFKLLRDVDIAVNLSKLSAFRIYELVVMAVMAVAVILTVSTKSRLTAIVGLGVVGYCICLIFIFYGAPDLAMTQFAIDTLTVVLFMLVMWRLPGFLQIRNTKIQVRDAIISIAFGALMSIITLQALVTPYDKKVSEYYARNAYVFGKGKNIVNVILVDFRGLDTMIESIVLSIAAIGVYCMLKLKPNEGMKE